MTNHFHLVVEVDEPSGLPALMRDFQGAYAEFYNARASRTGSLFENRYFSKPVTSDAQLLQCFRYVHRNPVDIVGLGPLPAYRWSSLGVYLGRRGPESWMSVDRVELLIDPASYLDEVCGRQLSGRLPLDELPPLRRTAFEEVDAAVVRLARIRRLTTLRCDRLVQSLALEVRAGTAVEIAARQGVHPASVRRNVRRFRVSVATDPAAGRLRRSALDGLERGE